MTITISENSQLKTNPIPDKQKVRAVALHKAIS
jgi:hypothetical protein